MPYRPPSARPLTMTNSKAGFSVRTLQTIFTGG
jgi:hypothetical protein